MNSFSTLATVGDSYTSGEGADDASGNPPVWDPGTDAFDPTGPGQATEWNMCHRADKAYARLYAAASVRFALGQTIHIACSGASTTNMFKTPQGRVAHNTMTGSRWAICHQQHTCLAS